LKSGRVSVEMLVVRTFRKRIGQSDFLENYFLIVLNENITIWLVIISQERPFSNFYINQYCESMGQQKMESIFQQLLLPWHIHRLHPLACYADCIKYRLGGQLVDKKDHNLNPADDRSVIPLTHFFLIDLAKAVVRHRARF